MKWITLFSQTGSEILEISRQLNRLPDTVIYNTNFGKLPPINEELIRALAINGKSILILPSTPSIIDYKQNLQPEDLITLHGWLRIIPEDICSRYNIYNGHPGLINEYPELKGKDPQKKAYDLGLEESGCVIHKVTPIVDDGKILKSTLVRIANLNLDDIIKKLHDASINLWIEFLTEMFKNENNN